MRQFSFKFIATISISQVAIQVQGEHDCYVRDVMYNYGQAIAQKTLGDHFECQSWCQLVRRCTFFSFNTKTKTCYLRQGDRSQPQQGIISGNWKIC